MGFYLKWILCGGLASEGRAEYSSPRGQEGIQSPWDPPEEQAWMASRQPILWIHRGSCTSHWIILIYAQALGAGSFPHLASCTPSKLSRSTFILIWTWTPIHPSSLRWAQIWSLIHGLRSLLHCLSLRPGLPACLPSASALCEVKVCIGSSQAKETGKRTSHQGSARGPGRPESYFWLCHFVL